MRESKYYLIDIVDTVNMIMKHVQCSLEQFSQNEVLIDFACFRLMAIGEALNKVSEKYQAENPQIEWREIIGMRNLLTHDYYGIDPTIVYQTIKNDLPCLKTQILEIIEKNGWLDEF